jgi:hypothetical protein
VSATKRSSVAGSRRRNDPRTHTGSRLFSIAAFFAIESIHRWSRDYTRRALSVISSEHGIQLRSAAAPHCWWLWGLAFRRRRRWMHSLGSGAMSSVFFFGESAARRSVRTRPDVPEAVDCVLSATNRTVPGLNWPTTRRESAVDADFSAPLAVSAAVAQAVDYLARPPGGCQMPALLGWSAYTSIEPQLSLMDRSAGRVQAEGPFSRFVMSSLSGQGEARGQLRSGKYK